ncbi:type II toxin-antitoxin system HicB family antitoxin [Anoxybacillus rupiensis]|uniref:Type II toxin-antitoxin system HicB family antitoxin n=1 Tax=Anoxybacteroides rupiense TaxID=311460 RepID=A0ABD5J1P1_9BACL|nr:type II toxin-antitoxin system HicB family antitoxin [Anoxybacillus rupiensis]
MNKKDRYIYPAVFDYADDGISVEFPDLPGCFTCGDTEEEAFQMAKEAMALHLYGLEQENEEIPQPSKVSEIQTENNQVIVFIEVWMPPFRHEMENKAVKKTLTIPKWLDDLAKQYDVNYSQILQEALKKHLGASDR